MDICYGPGTWSGVGDSNFFHPVTVTQQNRARPTRGWKPARVMTGILTENPERRKDEERTRIIDREFLLNLSPNYFIINLLPS